jgi:hypothetical protein
MTSEQSSDSAEPSRKLNPGGTVASLQVEPESWLYRFATVTLDVGVAPGMKPDPTQVESAQLRIWRSTPPVSAGVHDLPPLAVTRTVPSDE